MSAALPVTDRFFELRFESIGGLGAHGAGQILATAAVLRMGLNAAQFSSYGSEKKGSLVRTFVRLGPSNRPVRTSAPVDAPDVTVVFHPALLQNAVTFSGLRANGLVVYNAPDGPMPETFSTLPRTARVVRVDALGIAVAEKSRPNAALLGTLCASLPFFDLDGVRHALSEELGGKHPEAVAASERAFTRGAAEFTEYHGVGRLEGDLRVIKPEPVWGFATQPAGGVIPLPGNTVWNDLSMSRTGWMPVLDRAKCTHCGSCDLVCPDLCLVWGDGEAGSRYERELFGVDYQYCKGCMRCVESCPSGALTKVAETAGLATRLRVAKFPELTEVRP
jgi:pyruvate ferredoxin oxidoreductase gamma subunit